MNLICHLQIKVKSVLISLSISRIVLLLQFCWTIKQNWQEKTMGCFQWILKLSTSAGGCVCLEKHLCWSISFVKVSRLKWKMVFIQSRIYTRLRCFYILSHTFTVGPFLDSFPPWWISCPEKCYPFLIKLCQLHILSFKTFTLDFRRIGGFGILGL